MHCEKREHSEQESDGREREVKGEEQGTELRKEQKEGERLDMEEKEEREQRERGSTTGSFPENGAEVTSWRRQHG